MKTVITVDQLSQLENDVTKALTRATKLIKSGDEEKIMGRMIMLGQKSQKDKDTIAMLDLTVLTRLISIMEES